MRIALLPLLLTSVQRVSADINWPVYSQQCADDAGPPYADDEPGTYYHTGSAAYPVLNDRECAEPLKDACDKRPDFKTAYLEGPISCGNNGWYCRIFDDSANGWPTANLVPDLNFGQCNSADSFDDAGYDRDGHCHGSSDDSTYYWWIRDHWFRGYNGKVRCCCGWYEGGSQPLYGGRIANRCDYRKLIVDEQEASTCRDANEEHNLGFDDIGCNQQYRNQIGSPIPEDDSVCWEIERFGFTEETYSIPTLEPTLTRKPTTPPVVTPDTGAPTDSSSPTFLRTTQKPTVTTSNPTKRPVTASPTKRPVTATAPPTKRPVTAPPTNKEDPEEGSLRGVICGRGYDCGGEEVALVSMDEVNAVRCCRDCSDGDCPNAWKPRCEDFDPEVFSRSKFGGSCYEEDFCGAMAFCEDKGGRLCTPEEMLESCTKGSGCGFDRRMVWSCMWEEGECEWDEECCSGKCGDGVCEPAEETMCN